MAEKPNTQHEIGTIRIPLGNGNAVDIHGPDREANAKLFIAAQHKGYHQRPTHFRPLPKREG